MVKTKNDVNISKEIKKAIEEQRVFYALVTRIIPATKQQSLYVPISIPLSVNGSNTTKGVIFEDDLDADVRSNHFSYLIGMQIPFVITGVDENSGIAICSRSIAQEIIKEQMSEALKNGNVFEGIITGFSDFGAFVDVNGVMGMLRNADYSTDHSRVNERYKVGDHISVKCKTETASQRIVWEAANKYHRTEPVVCDFDEGAIVLGKVVDIKNFPQGMGVFVQMNDQKELDILCGMPPELEIEKNVSVIVRISSITPGANEVDKPRLRGHILRTA